MNEKQGQQKCHQTLNNNPVSSWALVLKLLTVQDVDNKCGHNDNELDNNTTVHSV